MKAEPIRQAMLLAAGRGERLRPLTDRIPKSMVPVGGKPVLEWNIERLVRYGIDDIVINLHYLPHRIREIVGDGCRWGIKIRYSYEETLLGTSGAVRAVAGHWKGRFLVWYGDNLSTCRLERLADFHADKGGLGSVALFERQDVRASGVVELDAGERIARFLEKPEPAQTDSHWVNAGIYVLEPEILASIPAGYSDFGKNIFPSLLAQGHALYGYRMGQEEGLWWIDTPQDLQLVQQKMEGRR